MSTTRATATPTAPARPDRTVLLGNLASGAVCLLPLVVVGSWPLAVLGAAYVVAAGTWLAAFHARGASTRGREAVAWAVPWLVAWLLWAVVLDGVSGSTWLSSLGVGLVLATPCYLVWQVGALAARQALAWRSGHRGR